MKFKTVVAATLIALFAAACSNNQYGEKQTVGTLGGAALGGLLGAQFGDGTGQLVATGAGVLIGGLIGSEIGRTMDEQDEMRANQAVTEAHQAPLGETIVWNNPDSGHSGTVTPVRDGSTSSGLYCREFQQTITVSGRTETAYGTACRQPDGTWKIVE
jgi:surface antigen